MAAAPKADSPSSLAKDLIAAKIEILKRNTRLALDLLRDCTVCPRQCHVDRTAGKLGTCGVPDKIKIASANLHHGEEPPISGWGGSGTIFFSGCNLGCRYCQNYPISQYRHGEFYTEEEVAQMMLDLQRRGAHNINFVTPTHYVPQIMAALLLAYQKGLTVPVVYNSSGYDSVETLKLLDGVVDIYMPDMRYADSVASERYSGAADYPEVNRAAIKEMHRQVGVLQIKRGVAVKGLLIRHLVLPENLAGSKDIFRFIAREVSPDTYVAVMSQYFPAYRANSYPPLDRRITHAEYQRALNWFAESGLHNGFIQPFMGGADQILADDGY